MQHRLGERILKMRKQIAELEQRIAELKKESARLDKIEQIFISNNDAVLEFSAVEFDIIAMDMYSKHLSLREAIDRME